MSSGFEDELGDPFSNSFLQELGIDTWNESEQSTNSSTQQSIAETPTQPQNNFTINTPHCVRQSPPQQPSAPAPQPQPPHPQHPHPQTQPPHYNFPYNHGSHYNVQTPTPTPPQPYQYRYGSNPASQNWSTNGSSARLMHIANMATSPWPPSEPSYRFHGPSASQLLSHMGHRNSQRMPQQMNYGYSPQQMRMSYQHQPHQGQPHQHPHPQPHQQPHQQQPHQSQPQAQQHQPQAHSHSQQRVLQQQPPQAQQQPQQQQAQQQSTQQPSQSQDDESCHQLSSDTEAQQLQSQISHLLRGIQTEETQQQLLDLQERLRTIRARQQQALLQQQQQRSTPLPASTQQFNASQMSHTLHYTPPQQVVGTVCSSTCQPISPKPTSSPNKASTLLSTVSSNDSRKETSETSAQESYPALSSCVISTVVSEAVFSQTNQSTTCAWNGHSSNLAMSSQIRPLQRNGYINEQQPQSQAPPRYVNSQQYQEQMMRRFPTPQPPNRAYPSPNMYEASNGVKPPDLNSNGVVDHPNMGPRNTPAFMRPRYPNVPTNALQGPNGNMPPPQVPPRMPHPIPQHSPHLIPSYQNIPPQMHSHQQLYHKPQMEQYNMPGQYPPGQQGQYPPVRPGAIPNTNNMDQQVVSEQNSIQELTPIKRHSGDDQSIVERVEKEPQVMHPSNSYQSPVPSLSPSSSLKRSPSPSYYSPAKKFKKIVKKKKNHLDDDDQDVSYEDPRLRFKAIKNKKSKQQVSSTKAKKRKRKGSDSEEEIDEVNDLPTTYDEAHVEKRRSGRTKRQKYVEEPQLDLSDTEIYLNNNDAANEQLQYVESHTEEDTLTIDKILGIRTTKRKIERENEKIIKQDAEEKSVRKVEQKIKEEPDYKTEKMGNSEGDDETEDCCVKSEKSDSNESNPKTDAKNVEIEEVEVEEIFVKYKNFSYLHCEWRTIEELEPFDKRISQKVRRFKLKRSQENAFLQLDEDDLFNPDYVEVEKVLDESEGKDGEETVLQYLVKWRGLGYDEATWEASGDVDPNKIEQYKKLNQVPPLKRLMPIERPSAQEWRQLKTSPIYKDGNTLREYQIEGVSWLLFNYYNQQNCILADEMGLGKTVQSVAFLQEISKYGIKGPFLVIVPLSTLGNWAREFEAWTDLNAIVYHGTQTSRNMIQEYELYYRDSQTGKRIQEGYKFQALITTYEVILQEIELLSQFDWRTCIIDEAHRLKNKNCKLSEGLKYLDLEHKVLLTGTPLQNNVEELFSLLNFLEPQRFNNVSAFLHDFGDLKTENQVNKLKTLLKPMMLRRLKEDVEKSLAAKEETVIEVELTNIQKKYYRAILEKNFTFLSKGTTSSANVPNLMNTMMELRKCCNHPYLITGAEDQILNEIKNGQIEPSTEEVHHAMIQASGKLVLIDKLLPKLKAGNHKVLIFSQMIRVLDILEDYLIQKKYLYERLDGRIRGNLRQEAIDRFSKPDSDRFIFLLCTRAGGLGINLTAADTVIIFDSDWNPQNDLQAQARCHRIGQVKMVKVYRLITRNSYEREMFDRASLKLGLDKAVLQSMKEGVKEQSSLSKKEIEDLLKKGAYGAIMDDDSAADQFCEEDIDQILQRRTQVIQLESGEKNSTFAKASFSASGNRNDIDIDDPNFWQKWAKKAEVEMGNSSDKNDLILLQPRHRKKITRFGNQDLLDDISDLDSTEESDAELAASLEHSSKKRGRKCAKPIRRMPKKDDDEDFVIDEYGDGYSRNECFKVEKYLMTYGWSRWKEIFERCRFKRDLTTTDCEKLSSAILTYCISQYHGDEKIKSFIVDLIQGKAAQKGHTGLADPVPRGRKNKKKTDSKDIDLSSLEDPLKLLIDEGYRKHLDKHSNKILLRIRLLFYVKQEIIGEEAEKILNNENLSEINIPVLPCSDVEKPSDWWDEDADKSLIIGIFKHGFGRYNSMRQDSCLSFLKRCGPPDDKALAAELKDEDDDEDDEDKDDSETEGTADVLNGPNDDEDYVSLPSVNDLNARVRKLVSAYQKDFKRVQQKLQKSARKMEKREKAEAESKEREKLRLDAKQKWSKREENDFYRVISNYGLENSNDGGYIWDAFKSMSRLDKKYDDTLTDYANAFLAMCKRVTNKEVEEESTIDPISEEKASKVLFRVSLLNKIRKDVLNHSQLDERLKLCSSSSELPTWYEPGIHDKYLLFAAAKHGLSKSAYYCMRDDEASFKRLTNLSNETDVEDVENASWHNINDVWPKYKIVLNRLHDVCETVLTGEWPKKSAPQPSSRSSTPASSQIDDQKEENLRLSVHKRHTRENAAQEEAAKQLQNWLLQSQMNSFSGLPGFDLKNSNYKLDFESLTGSESVSVVNRRSGKKLTSSKAPQLKNLAQWLRDHPSYDVDPAWYFVLSLPEWRLPSELEKRRLPAADELTTAAVSGAGNVMNPTSDLYGLAHLHLLAQQQALAYNPLFFNPLLAASMNYASLMQQPDSAASTASPSPPQDLSVKKDDLPEDLSVKKKSSSKGKS